MPAKPTRLHFTTLLLGDVYGRALVLEQGDGEWCVPRTLVRRPLEDSYGAAHRLAEGLHLDVNRQKLRWLGGILLTRRQQVGVMRHTLRIEESAYGRLLLPEEFHTGALQTTNEPARLLTTDELRELPLPDDELYFVLQALRDLRPPMTP